MQETKDDCTTCAKEPLTAEQVLRRLTQCDEVGHIANTLNELFFMWAEKETDLDQSQRSQIIFHYRAMMDFLQETENYERRVSCQN